MHNVLIRECSHDMVNTVDGRDMGQESVSEPLTFGSALDETSDISNGNLCKNLRLRFIHLAKLFKSLVRYVQFSDSWVNGTERVVFGRH